MVNKKMEDAEQNVVELWRFGMSFSGRSFMERSEGLGQKCQSFQIKSLHLGLRFSPSKSIVANNSMSVSLTLKYFSSPGDLRTQFHYEPKALLQFDIFSPVCQALPLDLLCHAQLGAPETHFCHGR